MNRHQYHTNPSTPETALPSHITLPEGVRYDGAIAAPRLRVTLHQFTDITAGPSKGASFSIEVQYLNETTLRRRLRELRNSFRIPVAMPTRSAVCPPEKARRLALEIPVICK